ncbi:MAG: cyclase family protein [Phycisphaerae bacterium]|nr:cyclase family protein [Phycisphaerae bacterium]
MTRLIDISPIISHRTAVFPGDTAFSRRDLMHVDRGDAITLSAITTTVHLGSHVDAPVHYGKGGRTMNEQPLDLYVGRCLVVRMTVGRGGRVGVDHVAGRVPFGTDRLLIATGTYPNADEWNDDFAGLEPDLVRWLDTRGVRLVGIDTPSVDCATSKDLPAHAAFFACDMALLEGLVLTDVQEGAYELIALPLRIEGADASPVRAVLRAL